MMAVRRELTFQDHIIRSYARHGGHAQKWASAWVGGALDLICSLPGLGMHLMEVKHLPTWKGGLINNPMTAQQRTTARKYSQSGGLVYLGIVHGSSHAIGSHLAICQTNEKDQISSAEILSVVPYVIGKGFSLTALFQGPNPCPKK